MINKLQDDANILQAKDEANLLFLQQFDDLKHELSVISEEKNYLKESIKSKNNLLEDNILSLKDENNDLKNTITQLEKNVNDQITKNEKLFKINIRMSDEKLDL